MEKYIALFVFSFLGSVSLLRGMAAEDLLPQAGALPPPPQEETFKKHYDYYLPYLVRVVGKNIRIAGSEHIYPWTEVPSWFRDEIVAKDRLLQEDCADDGPDIEVIEKMQKHFKEHISAIGGLSKVYLPDNASFEIPDLHEEFQKCWSSIARALGSCDGQSFSLLYDIGRLYPGFVATLNWEMREHMREDEYEEGVDHSLYRLFSRPGKKVLPLEKYEEIAGQNFFIENVEEVMTDFSQENLKALQKLILRLNHLPDPEAEEDSRWMYEATRKIESLEKEAKPLGGEGEEEKSQEKSKEHIWDEVNTLMEQMTIDRVFATRLQYQAIYVQNRCCDLMKKLIPGSIKEGEPFQELSPLEQFQKGCMNLEKAVNPRASTLDARGALDCRTQAWMPLILEHLDDNSALVVGAGHLVGDQGIFASLQKAGHALQFRGPDGVWHDFKYAYPSVQP